MSLSSWLRSLFSDPNHGVATWGKFVIPRDRENYHFMACGATGAGKSSLLRILMRSVLPQIKDRHLDVRSVIFDAKSEAFPDLASLGLQDDTLILNPFDARCTAWDMGRDITDEGQAQELAAVMVPQAEGGTNKYFYDATRLLLKTAAHALMVLRGTDWSFRDLLLACANVADLKGLANRAGLAGLESVEDFFAKTRDARSVRMTLTVENSAYSVIAAAWERARSAGRAFSIRDWVANTGPQVLVLGASKQSRTALATINRLVLQRVQQLTLDYPGANAKSGRRTWVFLDEFPALGAIPNLEEFLTEGRSRGVCVVLGFQHIAHVRKFYGDMANALVGQCLHQAYFRANDGEAAKWCASHFGLLITLEDDPGLPMHIKKQSPGATENDFLGLPEATERDGFECIVRSSKAVLPAGPLRIRVPPSDDLAAVSFSSNDPETARFKEWGTKLELKPWTAEERAKLELPEHQQKSEQVPLPVNDAPNLIPSSQVN